MCQECSVSGDICFIESVLPKYLDLMKDNPHSIIGEEEVNGIIARALHHHSESELKWIGGEQPVNDFVNTLKSLQADHH